MSILTPITDNRKGRLAFMFPTKKEKRASSSRAYRERNPEIEAARLKIYAQDHREKINARRRARYAERKAEQ